MALLGTRAALVPFSSQMVAKYHSWLQDPELSAMTETEPMSLSEISSLQAEYASSNSKWIFIILDRQLPEEEVKHDFSDLGRMAGDIDLFQGEALNQFEINFMIAEAASRRKGLAQEAIKIVGEWAKNKHGASCLVAKVLESNIASIKLLEKGGFEAAGGSTVFKELHFRIYL